MTYSTLILIPSFIDRYKALRLGSKVGDETFGYKRYLNQILYQTPEWASIRRKVISRDNGFDLAHEDFPINGRIYVHHINPITPQQIIDRGPFIFDLENLISVSNPTHIAIHFGDEKLLPIEPPERMAGEYMRFKAPNYWEE